MLVSPGRTALNISAGIEYFKIHPLNPL